MFRHTLLLAYRSFLRFKSTFFINLVGLSTGLAGALLIYLWVSDELSVDKFHEKDSRLFQVMQNWPHGDGSVTTEEAMPGLLGKALQEEIPEVNEVALTTGGNKGVLSIGNKRLKAKGLYATANFFTFFSYPLLQGEKNQVLSNKLSVVLSEELALKLFRTTNQVIGKTIEWNQDEYQGRYIITGIFNKPAHHSSATFDLLLPFQLYADKHAADIQNWDSHNPATYVILKEGTNVKALNRKIAGFLQTKNKTTGRTLFLRRYSDKYLYNHYENGTQTGGRIAYVKLFSIIALFILVIACINFMNLATARASRRLKEIGIKKVMGAGRTTLMLQYLGESLLVSLLALIVASLLVILLLPSFNQITGKQLGLEFDPHLLLSAAGIAVLTGLLAGSYPALYLSGFNPVAVLKGKLASSTDQAWARQGLVVFQFAISITLIVAVVVVYQQIDFIQSKNLGYNKNNILQFSSEGKLRENPEPFLAEVKNLPGVVQAASMGGNMTGAHSSAGAFKWEGKQPEQRINFGIFYVNYGLIETLGISLAEGRTFSRQFGADSSKIIFNQAAITAMGLKDPIGKIITLWDNTYQIVGVAKDFHFESLYEKVKPACFIYDPKRADQVMIKIASGTERATIDRIGTFYKKFTNGLPFEYKFLDEDYQELYAAENRVAVLSRYFAGIAILISCLGSFGLAAFTAERRRKEISVRKVLGASRFSIVYLLSSDFTKLVVVAIGISLPLSYLIVKNWLNNFEYRIDLHWWYFVGAGLAALLVAWLTVSTQAIKAASVNPAQSLKDE